ncbi:MAG: OB-fold nucleic acid binding domain-containing protein [Ignavibacteria bacterium]
MLGFYVSDHPLRKYEIDFKSFATIHLGETEELDNIDVVKACAVITEVRTKIDRSGNTMAFLNVDDFSGSCEALMFSKTYEAFGRFVKEEECVFITGRPESSGDAIKLQIDEVIPLTEAREKLTQSVKISFDKQKYEAEKISHLKNILEHSKGNIPVYLHLIHNGAKPTVFFLKDYRIKISDELIKSVTALLGEDSLILNKK